jgi:hypothetical protein
MHAGSRSHRLSLDGCLRNSQNETAAARKKSETKKPAYLTTREIRGNYRIWMTIETGEVCHVR